MNQPKNIPMRYGEPDKTKCTYDFMMSASGRCEKCGHEWKNDSRPKGCLDTIAYQQREGTQ